MTDAADRGLIEAVQAGDEAAVGRALAAGADPDALVGRLRGSVLNDAARNGRRGIVGLLVDAGAHIGPAGRFHASPLRTAVLEARVEVVRYLVDRGALPQESATRDSVVTEAVSATRFRPRPAALATLRVLLEAGATPHPNEESPLITAVAGPVAPAVLRLLLEFGADVEQRRSDGTPAIVVAARQGDHAAVDVLLTAGADGEARDRNGRTALMHAVERNEKRVVAALLLAGVAVDTVSTDGMTALRLARGWHRQNVEFMLGEHQAGMADVPIARTTVRVAPTAVRFAGDPPMFHRLASVIDVALADLGDDEWETRTSTDAETARAVAARLRDGIVRAANASWSEVEASAVELSAVRSALLEVGFGNARVLPPDISRMQILDVLDELNRQLGR